MGFIKLFSRSLILLIALGCVSSANYADEFLITGRPGSKISIGDFDCSKCATPSATMLGLFGDREKNGQLTAGELWQFFNSHGIDSVDRLTLCLDVQTDGRSALFGINSMELKIEDPSSVGALLTDASFKNNTLSIPGYDIAPFKPEAKLEVELGYDFMERFSADSTALVSLDVSGDESSQPVVSIEGNRAGGFFSNNTNSIALGAFAIFWALVFIALNRLTRRQVDATPAHKSSPPSQQALSA